MRKNCILLLLIFPTFLVCSAVDFDEYFENNRVRMNYSISGDYRNTSITDVNFVSEMAWGGSKQNLVDTFKYGQFMLEVYDFASDKLIYSRGYSNLFQEWQTTADAKISTKLLRESIILPKPKHNALIKIKARNKDLDFQDLFSIKLEPEELGSNTVFARDNLIRIHTAGVPAKALDVLFVSAGYSTEEESKFFQDVERFKNFLFSRKPYSDYKNLINIQAVFISSDTLKRTDTLTRKAVDINFSTFGIDRYLSVSNVPDLYDNLNGFCFDQLCVLVNSDVYAGGGIYNLYNIFTSDNASAGFLFVHEFGHGFAGLADEYFEAEVAYEDLVRIDIEPYEPNITTLQNFETKWKGMVSDSIPIPTPDSSKYDELVGVFEGARYTSRGVYRPARNCAMRSASYQKFCPVCIRSIEQMMRFYTE